MGSLEIPYDKISVDKATVEKVYSEIDKKAEQSPETSINIRSISNETEFSPAIVKDTFLILHLYGYLKATFLPRCKRCDRALANAEESVELLYKKAEKGEYSHCVGCHEDICGKDDLEIQLLFWLPKIDRR